jgi:hypothetical protein
MRKRHYRFLVALTCLAAVGCAEQLATVKPEDFRAQLRAGKVALGCREPCLTEWRRVQPQAAQLDAGGRWQDLAMLVARAGYRDDLSLYYLGRSAEGLGYKGAAAGYYRQSIPLSGTQGSCQNLSRACGGVALPRAAAARAGAIERELIRTRARPPEAAPQAPETPEAARAEPEVPPPSPVRPASGPPANEYIEPPAAR